jgi:hypothetical protein
LLTLHSKKLRWGSLYRKSEGILLVNSIIQGTVYQEKSEQFQIGSSKMSVMQQPRLCWKCMERSKRGTYRLDDGVPVAGSLPERKGIFVP